MAIASSSTIRRSFCETILAVAHGRICISYIDINKVNDTPLSQLTVGERELLAIPSDGWTNLQIATRTGISENTVKYHLKNLYDKLGVRNRGRALFEREASKPQIVLRISYCQKCAAVLENMPQNKS